MKKTIILAAIAAVLIGGGFYWYRSMSKSSYAPPATTGQNGSPAAGKTYPLSEVAKHATATDCWLAIGGKVYNVTPFIASGKHPGGAAILSGCGKDATVLFNTRPMGSGTPHSDKARSMLPNFFIGDLSGS